MPTPIYQRFSNQTLLLDQAAPLPTQDVGAFVTKESVTDTTTRYLFLTATGWTEVIDETTHPITYEWLSAYFGQELKPENAVVIYYDDATDASVDEAIDDAKSKGMQAYHFTYQGNAVSDISDQLDFAAYIQAQPVEIQGIILTSDDNAKDPASEADIGFQLRALSYSRTSAIYHPTGTVGGVDLTRQRPDAAIIGRMMPTYPETQGVFEQWDYKTLSSVSDSGLTAGEQRALRDKGYNFIERFKNTAFTHLFPGRTVTGREIRLQWAADWFDANVQASYANYAFRNELMAYDQETFSDLESIVRDWGSRAIDRRVLNEFDVNFPDPDTIPASVRATGELNITDLYDGELNSAIDEIATTGKWVLGGV